MSSQVLNQFLRRIYFNDVIHSILKEYEYEILQDDRLIQKAISCFPKMKLFIKSVQYSSQDCRGRDLVVLEVIYTFFWCMINIIILILY